MCKKKSATSCLPKSYSDYEKTVKPFLKIAQSSKSTPNQKRKASEEIGTSAAIAYNAKRHKISYSQSQKRHTEFRGSGVPDLTMEVGGMLEVKEAKGGTSGYGTCKDIKGKKRVTQCTPRYTAVIAHKMAHSNYKGRHPSVGCKTHKASPNGTCKNCKTAERDLRRKTGSAMQKGITKRKIRKIAIRGSYTKTCLRAPKPIEGYELDKTGNKKTITV